MGALTWREASSRINLPSGTDFTSNGTTYQPPLIGLKLNGSGQAVACATSADEIVGILMNCPMLNDSADILSINTQGTAKVQAGGTIAVGNYLTMGANGYAVVATQTAAGSQPIVRVFGRALTAATANSLVEFQPLYFLY